MAKHAVSYNQHLAEKYKIALHILQLHRIKKQPDEDTMKKGARDGKACGAIAFALNFLWLLSLFQDKESDKSTIEKCS